MQGGQGLGTAQQVTGARAARGTFAPSEVGTAFAPGWAVRAAEEEESGAGSEGQLPSLWKPGRAPETAVQTALTAPSSSRGHPGPVGPWGWRGAWGEACGRPSRQAPLSWVQSAELSHVAHAAAGVRAFAVRAFSGTLGHRHVLMATDLTADRASRGQPVGCGHRPQEVVPCWRSVRSGSKPAFVRRHPRFRSRKRSQTCAPGGLSRWLLCT